MAVNYSSVAEKIFRILKGSGYNMKMYDNQEGSEVADPEQARFFYVQEPNMMVNLDDKNAEIKMHKGPENMVQVQKTLDLLKNLSKSNLLDFDLREFGKEIKPRNYTFRLNTNTMSDNEMQTEGLSAPIGTPKTSSQQLEGAKLLIKHRKPVNEEVPGSRSRNIKALYVENADGERFKYPFIHLNGARAMTRHVQAGGTPYDEVGQSITGMSEQLSKIREVLNVMRRSPAVQEQAGVVMSSLLTRQDRLRETIKRLTTAEGYSIYSEGYTVPVKKEYDQSVLNSMKEKFTVTNVDNRIEELLPFITEVNDEENTLEKLRDVVKNKMSSAEFHEPTEKDVDTMPIQFTNDTMKVAARLALVAKLAKDDEVSSYLSRMAAKIRGEDKEPAGGSDAVDKRPYTKDDIQVILKMLDAAKVKSIIQQVEGGKMKMMKNPGDDAYDKAVSGESVLPEIKQIDESFDRMLGMFSPTHIHVEEDSDPETDFTKWLKMNYNKTPRDLSADEYAKMSKEFREQNKKTEASVEEGKLNPGLQAFLDKKKGKDSDDKEDDKEDKKESVEENEDWVRETNRIKELAGIQSEADDNAKPNFTPEQLQRAKDHDLDINNISVEEYERMKADAPKLKKDIADEINDFMIYAVDNDEVPVDDVYYDFNDYRNEVILFGDDATLDAFFHVRGIDDEDDHGAFIKSCQDALKMLGSSNEAVEEGAVKRAMETDAENMSKEEFMKKHGGPNADDEQASDFYDGYQGVEEADVEEGNEFIDARRQAIKNGDKEFTVGGKTFKVTGDTSDEKSQNEADTSDMFKGPHGKYSQTAQNKPVMFKGKQIDLDTVEYDMQDYSDMIFEPESGMKYTDGTEVADEDMEELMQNDDFVEWVRVDYMDKAMDRADMMRDSTELDIMKKNAGIQTEGGNAFDIAMGDAENIISQASGDKEAMDDLQRLHDEEDDSYAQSTIKDYMSRLEKEGLFRMQRDLAMQENKTPGHGHYDKESVDPILLRIKDLAGL